MKVVDTPLEGLKVIELQLFGDNRGFFVERFNADKFKAHDLPTEFLQDNHSRSAPGVIRGLHYQYNPPQGKMVGCVKGRIWDVAVDIRTNSPTYGQHFGVELSDENATLLWMPAGFAHGFAVLGDEPADVMYKVTATYNPEGEKGIAWDDPELAVPWPLESMGAKPVISDRDQNQPSFKEYGENPPW